MTDRFLFREFPFGADGGPARTSQFRTAPPGWIMACVAVDGRDGWCNRVNPTLGSDVINCTRSRLANPRRAARLLNAAPSLRGADREWPERGNVGRVMPGSGISA